jgi:hypothetical protein
MSAAEIAQLYSVFARQAASPDGFCTFCHDEARITRWLTTPLRALDDESTRPLLWETADHWPDLDTYKHFLPRMFEAMAAGMAPLYPAHPFETLNALGFAHWPAEEQAAVRAFCEAMAATFAARDDHRGPEWRSAVALIGVTLPAPAAEDA